MSAAEAAISAAGADTRLDRRHFLIGASAVGTSGYLGKRGKSRGSYDRKLCRGNLSGLAGRGLGDDSHLTSSLRKEGPEGDFRIYAMGCRGVHISRME